jgi:LL-diaminopimelate aminotransferase
VDLQGMEEMMGLIKFYKENAALLRKTFTDMGFTVYGGTNAPYIWVGFPGRDSWEVFAEILEKCHVVTTPGSGFGPAGDGFVRVSAFGSRDNVTEAIKRFQEAFSPANAPA